MVEGRNPVKLIGELAESLAELYSLSVEELREKLLEAVAETVKEILSWKLFSDLAEALDEVERLPEGDVDSVFNSLKLEKQAEGVIVVEKEGFTYANRLMRFAAKYRLRSELPDTALPVALLSYWYYKLGIEAEHAEFAVIRDGKLSWYGWPEEALEELVKPLISEVFGESDGSTLKS